MELVMRILALILTLGVAGNAHAFSAGGHRIIAEIAWQQLDENKRAELVGLIKHHPRLQQDFIDKMGSSVGSVRGGVLMDFLRHGSGVQRYCIPGEGCLRDGSIAQKQTQAPVASRCELPITCRAFEHPSHALENPAAKPYSSLNSCGARCRRMNHMKKYALVG